MLKILKIDKKIHKNYKNAYSGPKYTEIPSFSNIVNPKFKMSRSIDL